MMFRKNSLLFYHSEILSIIIAILSLVIVPTLRIMSILFIFPLIAFILANPQLHNEFITINETGISCQQSGKQLWAYEWDSIAELRKSSRFMLPSIEVIVYNKYGEAEKFALHNQYFQLGRTARKAVKQYYKPTEHPLNQ